MDRRNVIFIHLDQWHHKVASCRGDSFVHTPNMDAIINRGADFSNSYSSNPVCCPARTCWYTGVPSYVHGTLINGLPMESGVPIVSESLRLSGCECFYAGKWHISKKVSNYFHVLDRGFHVGETADESVAETTAAFLQNYDGKKPFFLNAGFLNPHDCCYMGMDVLTAKGPLKVGVQKRKDWNIPPLPPNYKPERDANFPNPDTENAKGLYLYSYRRFVEAVDACVGLIMDSLNNSKFANNTIVILSSDHGDMLLEFGKIGKSMPNQASVKVPLAMYGAGIKRGVIDVPVSSVDLVATVADILGAKISDCASKFSKSFLGFAQGEACSGNEFVFSEIFFKKDYINKLVRSAISKDRKYVFKYGEGGVEVYDTINDSFDMRDISSVSGEQPGIEKALNALNRWACAGETCSLIRSIKGGAESIRNFNIKA